jgi:DNA repair protein RadC
MSSILELTRKEVNYPGKKMAPVLGRGKSLSDEFTSESGTTCILTQNKRGNAMKSKSFVFHVKETSTENAICCPRDVYRRMKKLAKADQESMWVIGVNIRNKETINELLFVGGVNECSCDIKILFKRLLNAGAYMFVLAHNHPGGDPAPSKNDIDLTKKTREASKIIDIHLVDHIIIGDGKYYSFKEKMPFIFV